MKKWGLKIYKKKIISCILIAGLLIISSCEILDDDDDNVLDSDNVFYDSEGILIIYGTMRFIDVEFGCWQLESIEGRHYAPINLPERFKQNGIFVKVHAKLRPDIYGICRTGLFIEVLSIRKIEVKKPII